MAADVPSKWRTIAIWALRVVLGLVFLYVGTTKLTGTGHTIEYFAAIGWGQWFRYLTGVLDIAGVALLFAPKWTRFGAIMLACSVGTGTLISLTGSRVIQRGAAAARKWLWCRSCSHCSPSYSRG